MRKEENKMNKTGKVVRTLCYCGRYFNNATGEWQGASKNQAEMDKKLAEQGHLQNKLILCPDCKKGGQL